MAIEGRVSADAVGKVLAMKRTKYKVIGNGPFGVAMQNGVIEYDLLDTKKEATDICAVLNDGIGPEWDAVEAELLARLERER
jgi:hypothetical protein